MTQDDECSTRSERQAQDAAAIHRLRNVLAVIRSIVRRTGETSQSVQSFASHVDGRISAYARLLSDLRLDPEVGLEIGYIVAEQLAELSVREDEQVRIEGPPIRLAGKTAQSFGLAIHELALNALEHGALSRSEGSLEVTWELNEEGLDFRWEESGAALFADPRHRGFGMDLLERTLPYELGARVGATFGGDDLLWTIALPLAALQRTGAHLAPQS